MYYKFKLVGGRFFSFNFSLLLASTLIAAAAPNMTTASQANSTNGLAAIRAKLTAFEARINAAKSNGIDTSYEEVTVTTAGEFLTNITWDLEHPETLARVTAKYEWLNKQEAPKLAAAIPGQEVADTLYILDHALAELGMVEKNPALRRHTPKIGGPNLKFAGDYWCQNGCPVFPSSLIWMPEDEHLGEAFGLVPTCVLSLNSLADDGLGIKPTALQDLKRRVEACASKGVPFEVYMVQSPPRWAVQKHSEILQGRRQFVGYDIDHPLVREMWQKCFAEAAPVIGQEGHGLANYMMANEPHWFTTKEMWSTGSVSEYTFQLFRQWLARHYHDDLSALNRNWGKKFASFEAVQIDLPMDWSIKGSALWYDWCRFNMDRVNDFFTFLTTEIKKHDPQARCDLKLVTDQWLPMFDASYEKDNGVDFESLAAEVEDICGADTAAQAPGDDQFRRFKRPEWRSRYAMGWQVQSMYYDFLKSVAPKKLLCDEEYHAFSTSSWRAPDMRPEYVRSVLWLAHLHGMGMNLAWYWPRRADGRITGQDQNSFYGSIGMQPLVMDAYGRTMKEVNAYAPEIVALARSPKPLRLFYSTDSAIQSHSFHEATAKTYEASYFLSVPVGFVTERMLAADSAADQKQYPVLLVPSVTHVKDSTLALLKQYMSNGGTLVLLGDDSLAYDEYGHVRSQETLAFLKDAPRISLEQDVESVGLRLESILEDSRVTRSIVCRDMHGKIPWGVHCVSVKQGQTTLVHLINLGKDAKIVSLLGAKQLKATELIANSKLDPNQIVLKPFEMKLLSFAN